MSADFGAPVATQVNVDPSKTLRTLSDIVNFRTGQQQLQQEQLKTNQMQGVQSFFSNWDPSQHRADDGTTDLDSALQSPGFKAAGNAKPAIMQALLDIKNKQLDAKGSLARLNSSLVTQFNTGMGALADDDDVKADKTDPATGVNTGRAKVDQFLSNFSKLSPDAARVASIFAPITQHAPPGKLATGINALQLMAQSASEQQAAQFPRSGAIDTGADVLPTTTPPRTGVPRLTGQDIPKGIPPGMSIQKDANGQQFVVDQNGRVIGKLGAPSAGRAVGTGGFTQPIPGQQAAQQAIEDTRRADADYGVNRHINDQIIRLSQNTATGPGTQGWHAALGAIAGPFGGDNVADYQTIGAYLDRQAALSARQMGLPDTNAGLATAASLSGTTGYQPQALQTKVKLTDALVEGAHQYREGLDRVVGTGANQDLSNYQRYRAAWAQNFDPNVFRLENAVRRGDTEEIQALKKELGPKGLQALRQKRTNLIALSNGQIPGG